MGASVTGDGGRLRILVLAQQLAAFRSGVGTYVAALVGGLAARGHAVTVAVQEGEAQDVPGVEVVTVARSRLDPTPHGKVSIARAFTVVLRERARDFDVAHFADAREAWTLRRPPIAVTGAVHDTYALDWNRPGFPRHLFADRTVRGLYFRALRCVERRTYRKLDLVAANSDHVARALTDGYGLPAARVRVVRYGLPPVAPVSAAGVPGEPSILFVGGNFHRKGLPTLLEAAARLRSRFPGIRVHVVGKDRHGERLVRRARDLGLADAVVFHGWLPNERVRGLMAGATVFAMPSTVEAFGYVYLEAMVAGTPVVATAEGGAREGIADGTEALFVAPGDPDALAAALASIASEPAVAARLREGGRRAAGRFTVEAMVAGTETLLRDAVAARRARGP